MDELAIYSDKATEAEDLRNLLGKRFELRFFGLSHIRDHKPGYYTLFDIHLKDSSRVVELKEWLEQKPEDGKAIFIVDRASHLEMMRAHAIGATHVLHRPLRRFDLRPVLWADFAAIGGNATDLPPDVPSSVSAAFDALQNVFSSACLGERLDPESLNSAGEQIVSQISTQGLADWIEAVRKHHSQTYQHCLLVTGIAVAFAQHLGCGHTDRMRLSSAGMLHDIGKARIPVSILEKPGPLDQDELAVMRQHPQFGIDALKQMSGIAPEMMDVVLHHHEYLDGSGYPHGLKAGEIPDLVRIMTICDVFGALLERRSYKPPLSSDTAYKILLDMGPKLDQDLVREFRGIARLEQHH
jgi:putative nucleotidyltransferase with HDIG domain